MLIFNLAIGAKQNKSFKLIGQPMLSYRSQLNFEKHIHVPFLLKLIG
ncbi:hypothetical protein N824_01180 [Pedobacter sp. V48]|nr:hypothetical protein N824_01180 [Pedobacter sp. V48]